MAANWKCRVQLYRALTDIVNEKKNMEDGGEREMRDVEVMILAKISSMYFEIQRRKRQVLTDIVRKEKKMAEIRKWEIYKW